MKHNFLHPLYFLVLLLSFISCKGQEQKTTEHASVNASGLLKGDTVAEIDKCIWIIFQDSRDNFWFGSNGQGVYRYDGKTLIQYTTKDGLCNNQIRGTQEDRQGNIYFNTLGGISKFDGRTFTTLNVTGNNTGEWKSQPGDLWFQGAQDAGVVYRYDGSNLYCLTFPETEAGAAFKSAFPRARYPHMTFSPYDVYSIYTDSKGNLWFGTSSLGVCRYDPHAGTFTWLSENDLGASPVRSIFEDKNGGFWFGNSDKGVYYYDGKNLSNYRLQKGIGNLKGIAADAAVSYMTIMGDRNGDTWISTFRSGVWRYDGEDVTYYPVGNGTQTITSFSMYKDKHGDLWLATNEAGVYKFNGSTFEKFRF